MIFFYFFFMYCFVLFSARFKIGWKAEMEVYKMLKDVTDNLLATSGYSEVNLAKLFQAFISLKYWPTVPKQSWVIRYGIIFMPFCPPTEAVQCYIFILIPVCCKYTLWFCNLFYFLAHLLYICNPWQSFYGWRLRRELRSKVTSSESICM